MMAPYGDHHYYDKDKERYVPQTSMVWMGSSRISDGIMHGSGIAVGRHPQSLPPAATCHKDEQRDQ